MGRIMARHWRLFLLLGVCDQGRHLYWAIYTRTALLDSVGVFMSACSRSHSHFVLNEDESGCNAYSISFLVILYFVFSGGTSKMYMRRLYTFLSSFCNGASKDNVLIN